MFKRIFWMSTGVAVGAGSAFWAKRKVEATVERYLPERLRDHVYYEPADQGFERDIRERLARWRGTEEDE